MKEPKVKLVRLAGGQFNALLLIKPPLNDAPASPDSVAPSPIQKGQKPLPMWVAGIAARFALGARITDAQIDYTDQVSQQHLQLGPLTLVAENMALRRPLVISVVSKMSSHHFGDLQSQFEGKLTTELELFAGTLRIAFDRKVIHLQKAFRLAG